MRPVSFDGCRESWGRQNAHCGRPSHFRLRNDNPVAHRCAGRDQWPVIKFMGRCATFAAYGAAAAGSWDAALANRARHRRTHVSGGQARHKHFRSDYARSMHLNVRRRLHRGRGNAGDRSQILFFAIVTSTAFACGTGLGPDQRSVLTLSICTRNVGAALAPMISTVEPDNRTVVMVVLGVPLQLIFAYAVAKRLVNSTCE